MCCYTYTPTTDLYTYWHTLSLLDALPICRQLAEPIAAADLPRRHGMISLRWRSQPITTGGIGWLRHRKEIMPRSEEHTSELQSLMRISYAAFCLKKKPDNTATR